MSNNLPTNPAQKDGFTDPNSYLSNYYNTALPVSGQTYDAVLTFFLRRTKGNRSSAEALTATIMTIAQNKGIDPMLMLDQFKNIREDTAFQASLIALINSDRRETSKLGFAAKPSANPYVERNITR